MLEKAGLQSEVIPAQPGYPLLCDAQGALLDGGRWDTMNVGGLTLGFASGPGRCIRISAGGDLAGHTGIRRDLAIRR